jgi:protocatechuate 3,4-dioxygenase beta subunit
VDERLNRSNITSDPTNGSVSEAFLALDLTVSSVNGAGLHTLAAQVDMRHCDVWVSTSDERRRGAVGYDRQKFLRGYQVTDANGGAEFLTIYPGWYSGRTVHIHFKVARPRFASGRVHFSAVLRRGDYGCRHRAVAIRLEGNTRHEERHRQHLRLEPISR